jgi:hypothetical protein
MKSGAESSGAITGGEEVVSNCPEVSGSDNLIKQDRKPADEKHCERDSQNPKSLFG